MSFLSSLFSGGNFTNPYDQAMKTYQPFGQQLSPYEAAGGYSLPRYEQGLGEQMQDNGVGQIDNILNQYHYSPWAQHETQGATQAANNAATASGLLGTPQEQEALAGKISGITSQDQQQFLNNALGQYDQGLQGLYGLSNLGYNATNQYGDYLGNLANYQAQRQNAQNQHDAARNASLWGGIGTLGGLALATHFKIPALSNRGWFNPDSYAGNTNNFQMPYTQGQYGVGF